MFGRLNEAATAAAEAAAEIDCALLFAGNGVDALEQFAQPERLPATVKVAGELGTLELGELLCELSEMEHWWCSRCEVVRPCDGGVLIRLAAAILQQTGESAADWSAFVSVLFGLRC